MPNNVDTHRRRALPVFRLRSGLRRLPKAGAIHGATLRPDYNGGTDTDGGEKKCGGIKKRACRDNTPVS
ncbi:MAG: hypothetical protein VYA69_14845 [Gemmatimonadota bacterium]|nr:hypothetical protein [Gemmatimonadota bacterium]